MSLQSKRGRVFVELLQARPIAQAVARLFRSHVPTLITQRLVKDGKTVVIGGGKE